jgi:hypothetical protein
MIKTFTIVKTLKSNTIYENVTKDADFSSVYLKLEKLRSEPSSWALKNIMQFCNSYMVLGKNKREVIVN